jgi:hypothetical protein
MLDRINVVGSDFPNEFLSHVPPLLLCQLPGALLGAFLTIETVTFL